MQTMKLSCVFHFAASHFLTKYHGKCEHLHGHNYKLIVTIKGSVKGDGMVTDFSEIKRTVKKKVIDKLDHKHLNDIIENPSSEHIALWVWDKLKDDMPLAKISVHETENQWAEYDGN
jgi:6-pyruvoyltetrahydropterin/6-carboxytetrahydropterin synthase